MSDVGVEVVDDEIEDTDVSVGVVKAAQMAAAVASVSPRSATVDDDVTYSLVDADIVAGEFRSRHAAAADQTAFKARVDARANATLRDHLGGSPAAEKAVGEFCLKVVDAEAKRDHLTAKGAKIPDQTEWREKYLTERIIHFEQSIAAASEQLTDLAAYTDATQAAAEHELLTYKVALAVLRDELANL